jgi:ribosome-binding factor A
MQKKPMNLQKRKEEEMEAMRAILEAQKARKRLIPRQVRVREIPPLPVKIVSEKVT